MASGIASRIEVIAICARELPKIRAAMTMTANGISIPSKLIAAG